MTALRLGNQILCVVLTAVVLTAAAGCSRTEPADPSRQAEAGREPSIPAFDETRAFDLLKEQVAIGPRCPNSPGHDAGAEFIQSRLKPYADDVAVQGFSQTVEGKNLDLRNIVAHFNASAKDWVLLAAHWDTRPTADLEIDAEKRKTPIPGANDGASGTAVLLELARMFAESEPKVGVVMVFFDGEDYGQSISDMFLGSKHFAEDIAQNTAVAGRPINIRYGILLDMVGDSNLAIYQEVNSLNAAPDVVRKVWKTAEAIGYGSVFVAEPKHQVQDDHLPLIRAGMKCIDIIDFDYGPWHTLDDTVDKCSANSLKAVGKVVARVIYEEKAP